MTTIDLVEDELAVALHAAMVAAYSEALARTELTPLEALEAIASALGGLYREVAVAHGDAHGCQCGWVPDEGLDLLALEAAMAANAAADTSGEPDLRDLVPVGHG
jgi:hypothetical protein